ncbi:TetR/AcrR family transcriptional regulator [Streptomyces olivoreticuli]|uniref:TetR/AcrR family transcriptional regulator n=1 Tax=Streptomyces olivoreticuli TaxID=68246 RepID=UPI001F080E40|nr:TetR/AcrR family transcriptional regulator [Streptomyces olivoreticuli]
MSTDATPKARAKRRDAQRNREKLIDATMDVFTERGLDVPLEEIARRAGVSIGTLYNHFPSRDDLIAAFYPAKFAAQIEDADRALECAPWEGFVWYLARLCERQACDRGLSDLLSRRLPDTPELRQACAQSYERTSRIIARAQQDGSLRADFTPQDLTFVIWSSISIIKATAAVAPDAWRRHLAFLLDGCRATAAHPIATPSLDMEQVLKTMPTLGTATAQHE